MSELAQLTGALAGRYAIDREIGAGGMATVYLARDLKHDRKVALKVLKPELGAVVGVERFLAEIKVTANLLPLFDSGEASGLLFYVMPFVEGETLRARLDREKQLPIDDAVRIATSIASALDYAHRHGVIHRDLKPENILLHDGQPLVADFGIALAVTNAGGQRITQTGLSLGTPQYMSPEQATGDRSVDGRTDIYSLGALTYEMFTGEAPHVGSTAQAIIAKLMTEDVRPLTVLRRNVPPAVDAAVRHALEKLPADRWATANEFAAALQNRGDAALRSAYPQPETRSEAAVTTWRPRAREVTAWLVAGVAIAAFAFTLKALHTAPKPQVVRTVLDLTPGDRLANTLLVAGTTCGWIAVSPAGDRLAYVVAGAAGSRTVIRRIDELNAREIANKALAGLGFSPDGKWLAYSDGLEVRKLPVDGGMSVTLGSAPETVRGMTWTDADLLVLGTAHGLRALPAGGGAVRPMFGADSALAATCPVAMPDGKHVLYAHGILGNAFHLAVAAIGTGASANFDLPLAAPLGVLLGHVLYVNGSGVLMALPFDASALRPTGEPVPIEDGIMVRDFNDANATLSRSGTLAFVQGGSTSQLVLAAADVGATPLVAEAREYGSPRFSPDGRKIAVTVTTAGSSDIWVYDISARTFTRLTTEGVNNRPEWSPDGTRILFRSQRGAKLAVWWQPSDGSARAELLYEPEEPFNEALISPDAKWLVYRTSPGGPHSADIMAVSLAGERKPVPLVTGPAIESLPRISPDGAWLAYQSNESGRVEIYLRPFMRDGARVQVSDQGGAEALWSRSGKALYYRTVDGIVSVPVTMGAKVSIGERRTVLTGEYLSDPAHANYDVLPDGSRFLMLKHAGAEARGIIVHNWGRELREKLAAAKK
jgi:hypothetical protein